MRGAPAFLLRFVAFVVATMAILAGFVELAHEVDPRTQRGAITLDRPAGEVARRAGVPAAVAQADAGCQASRDRSAGTDLRAIVGFRPARGPLSMDGVGVIDRFLEVFTGYIDSGFGLLDGDVAFLATTLIVIDVTLAGLFWAWGADEDILARLVRKTLFVGAFAYIIGNWNALARIVFESFAGLGLVASGGSP